MKVYTENISFSGELLKEFRTRYGKSASNLVIFYASVKKWADEFVRLYYPPKSYARFREVLIKDGFLSPDDFGEKVSRFYSKNRPGMTNSAKFSE